VLLTAAALLVAAVHAAPAPPSHAPAKVAHSINVWATAYNSFDEQTDDTPHHGAWGDALDDATQPGVRVIAVSPDLVQAGLTRGKRVRIKGLKGEFVVLDKMPARWTKRIDIYMQKNERAARRWGRRRVKVYWED
jgi:3D (Asp-Asp-Asp) domain-containing protein